MWRLLLLLLLVLLVSCGQSFLGRRLPPVWAFDGLLECLNTKGCRRRKKVKTIQRHVYYLVFTRVSKYAATRGPLSPPRLSDSSAAHRIASFPGTTCFFLMFDKAGDNKQLEVLNSYYKLYVYFSKTFLLLNRKAARGAPQWRNSNACRLPGLKGRPARGRLAAALHVVIFPNLFLYN